MADHTYGTTLQQIFFRFYRLVLQPVVVFDDSGKVHDAAFEARFTALPSKQLLTLSLIPPDAWMVQSVHAVYDLDNIKMGDVSAVFWPKCKLKKRPQIAVSDLDCNFSLTKTIKHE